VRYIRFVPLALLLAVAAGCGSSGGAHRSSAGAATTTSTSAPTPTSSANAGAGASTTSTSTSTAAGTGAAGTPGSVGAAGATGAAAAGSGAQSGSGGSGQSATGTASSGSGLPPAAPGTYQERQSGSFTVEGSSRPVPAQGTLVVGAAQADGTQLWQRYVAQGQQPSDTTIRFTAQGPFLLSTTESSPQGNITCTFDPAIPAPAWPAAVGDKFSSTGDCGKFTISVSGAITGQKQVTVGGVAYQVWVIDSTLSLHGEVTGSGSQEDWYSPALRLPVHEYDQLKGSYGAFTFSSTLTSDLVSGTPT
jgi:hypothetical protein